jgi:hypothetical protein
MKSRQKHATQGNKFAAMPALAKPSLSKPLSRFHLLQNCPTIRSSTNSASLLPGPDSLFPQLSTHVRPGQNPGIAEPASSSGDPCGGRGQVLIGGKTKIVRHNMLQLRQADSFFYACLRNRGCENYKKDSNT